MTSIRRLLGLFATIALVAFALPAVAASGNNKIFNLNMLLSDPLVVGTSGAVTAKFENVSPDGNSTFKSLKLYVPSNSGITITGASIPAGFTGIATIRDAAGTIVSEGTSVWVDVINLPVKPFGPAFPLALTVKVSCDATGGSWSTFKQGKDQVWTGTGWGGQNFAYNTGNLSTGVSGSCNKLSFANQPNNALANTQITTTPFNTPAGNDVTVTAKNNGSPVPNVLVSVASVACSITGSATTDVNGVADFSGLKSTAGTSVTGCTLTATATNFPDSAPSNSFAISAGYPGVLGCTSGTNTAGDLGSLVLTQSGFEGAATWGLVRGNNWNPETCTLVPYIFTFDGTTGVSSFTVDNAIKGAQKISAEYVLLFNPVSISAWPTFHPVVAWPSAAGTFGHSGTATPDYPEDYVPALACLDDNYIGANVLPLISSAGTFAPDYATAAGYGNSQYGTAQTAMMCIANTGWTSMILPNAFFTSPPFAPGAYIQPWFKIIDRSDGFTHQ